MSELRSLLEQADRAASHVPVPGGGLDRLLRLRDRKRRNQRIAAGVVGIAVFVAAVWIVTTGVPSDRAQPAVTGPTVVPPPSTRVGLIGLPPEGTTPSAPETGEVVLRASGRCTPGAWCSVLVYADGRLIWIADRALPYGANERTTGLLEQRLTQTGVELLVSEFTSTGMCSPPSDSGPIDCIGVGPSLPFPAITRPGWSDPAWGLPASAWEDPEIRAFVPSRFGACFLQEGAVSATWQDLEPSRVLAWIPPSAADLLRGKDVEIPRPGLDDVPMPCFALTTEETRELSERLDEEGIERDKGMRPYMLGYQLVGPSRFPEPVLLIGPLLPSGEWSVSGFA